MFVFSVKATRKRLTMLVTGLVAAIGMTALALTLPPSQAASTRPIERKVTSAEERVALSLQPLRSPD